MSHKKAILFDLDGTLLPMDQDVFVEKYFGALAARMAPYGYEPRTFIKAVWRGTAAMVSNDGRLTNEEVYWRCFTEELGERVLAQRDVMEDFYRHEFQQVAAVCPANPAAAETIRLCRALGYRRILATNPLFPAVGTLSRIRWAGLDAADFELITTYENSRFCKPKPDYYRAILSERGLAPEECCMVGNDTGEDMTAETLGMDVFLLTDCLINKSGADLDRWPHGDFAALQDWLRRL